MKQYIRQPEKAFTLMELMIVVVVLGIMAGFAIPNYQRAIQKSHERDATSQLIAMHAANLIYRSNTGTYLIGTNLDHTDLNTSLGINIIALDKTYDYSDEGADAYTCDVTWTGGSSTFTISLDESIIDPGVNPTCSGGTCYTL